MQKRYRFKKGLMSIMTVISVLLVAVCLTGCEEPQSVPVLKNGLCIIEAAESKTLVSSIFPDRQSDTDTITKRASALFFCL